MQFFATCPKHLEQLLAEELSALGGADIQQTVAGVAFSGDLAVAYRACLWSRLANRVLLPLETVAVEDGDALYEGVRSIDWLEHLSPQMSLAVDCTGRCPGIGHTRYGAQRVKDAVVDLCRERTGERPSVDLKSPDVRINVHLQRSGASIAIDLGGGSLHRRGYRREGGEAPLKENLAAAILIRAGWGEMARSGAALADPMCGSGTLLIEGACIAADIAPGLLRGGGLAGRWLGHDRRVWSQLEAEARVRRDEGLERTPAWIRGYEAEPKHVRTARQNISAAGLSGLIKVRQAELAAFAPRPDRNAVGLVVCNPPYGKRLGDAESLVYLYRGLGQRLKAECCGWRAAVFTGNPELGKRMGLRARKLYSFLNGTIPCQLLMFDVTEEWFVQSAGPRPAAPKPSVAEIEPGPGAEMFANRLKKNLRRLGKWARKHGIECYRLYDADMPEYALAIDCYGDWLHVQEYAPPSSIDPEKAASRLAEALAVIPRVLNLTPDRVVFKQRKRQRGRSQYEARDRRGEFIEVGEGSCRLLVNLTDYLDTGLFLDHRPLRRLIGEEAKGLRFLNLFCYTATATVHAVLGGAASSVSVDTSATYLGWARRNLSLNGLSEVHELVQRDCREFLAQEAGRFDLIFLDPPTFSNTKRADRESFDLQRDHVGLIRAAAARLDRNGVLYFSNNYRRFKMDLESLSAELVLDNITPATIDRDFERNPRIHNCWKIQRNDDV